MSLRDRIGIDVGRRLRLEEALEWALTSKRASPFCAVETSSPKHGVPDLRRRLALNAQPSQSELSLSDALQ